MNSTHFISGERILEPPAKEDEFVFENNSFLFSHLLTHVIALHYRERWDDLNIVPRNDLHKILKTDSIRQIVTNNTVVPSSRSISKANKWERYKKSSPFKDDEPDVFDESEDAEESSEFKVSITEWQNPEEFKTLQDNPLFMELAAQYQKKLANLLSKCNSGFYQHYHVLKSTDNYHHAKFLQVVKMVDIQAGIVIIASIHFRVNSNSETDNFNNGDNYVIASGYRFWRSKTPEEREYKFNRSEKDLITLEGKHDREYPCIHDIQIHYPEEESESNGIEK